MKIILEKHAYAPELNKAYIGPARVCIPAPGCKTIGEVRNTLFAPIQYTGRHVVLRSINRPELSRYNRTNSGFCNDLRSLAGALKVFRGRYNLPGCEVEIKTRLIG